MSHKSPLSDKKFKSIITKICRQNLTLNMLKDKKHKKCQKEIRIWKENEMKILEMRNTATNKERVDAVNRTEWSEVRTSELEDRKIAITQSELQRFKGKQKQKRTESGTSGAMRSELRFMPQGIQWCCVFQLRETEKPIFSWNREANWKKPNEDTTQWTSENKRKKNLENRERKKQSPSDVIRNQDGQNQATWHVLEAQRKWMSVLNSVSCAMTFREGPSRCLRWRQTKSFCR